MKRLEFIQFFTHTGEFDGLARDTFEAQSRAAAGIAVQFRENGPCDIECLVEMRGDIDGFLAGSQRHHYVRV